MSKKISEMTTASALSGTELVEVVQSGENRKTTAQDIADLGGGGGIGNTAAANEMMKSNGTDAVPSGLFSTNDGDVTLGATATTGGSGRRIDALGTGANIALTLQAKGTGVIRFSWPSLAALDVSNPSGTAILLRQLNPGIFTVSGYDGSASAGGVSVIRGGNGDTNGDGGNLYITPGVKAGSGADGNLGLLTTSGSFGSGQKVIFEANATTVPSTNPTGGAIRYVEAGVEKYRDTAGNIITI